jgi:aspartate/methionine/tyrosine aminotransferase
MSIQRGAVVPPRQILPGRMGLVPPSSFDRLAELLSPITPEFAVNGMPVMMTVGEPQDAPPAFVTRILDERARDYGRYPPIAGTPNLRAACAAWLTRRFALPDNAVDADQHILPLAGSREGLFYALFALVPETKNGGRPVVLIPNPFYGVYPAAVLAAGAEPHYVPSRRETRFLPDFSSVPRDILRRTVAAFYCSPSNPESACADAQDWAKLFALADEYDFTVLADECYADIYDREPPIGALSVRHAARGTFERLLSFHSLSKRSNLPGLRSGFMAGPPPLMASLRAFRNLAAPQLPIPAMAGSAAAWNDDVHVEENRALYRRRFDIAERLLGNARGFRRPPGGFYLWLDVGHGARFAAELWRTSGVRVMPGAFMGEEDEPRNPASNPGHSFVRIALVHDLVTIMAALERVAETLHRWDYPA